MFEITQDISTIIIWRQHNMIIYYRFEDDISWVIVGKCNETGLCPKLRMELDCPITPDCKCECGIMGVYV